MNIASLGLLLARNRRRAGLTQLQVAQRMGTKQPVIARAESGGCRPSLDFLERFANATCVPIVIKLGVPKSLKTSVATRRRRVRAAVGDFVFDPWLRHPTPIEQRALEVRGLTREHFQSKRASS